MKIVIMGCISSGGMLHYTENLYNGVVMNADAKMVLIGSATEREGHPGKAASLFIGYSANKYIHKILEKYNPDFYKKIASKICAVLKPDIVHITSYSPGILSLVKALKHLGIMVIYTVHDPEPHEEGTTLWGKVYSIYQNKYQLPKVMQYCDAIHVHSVLHLETIRKLYGNRAAEKTYVVQHGSGLTQSVLSGNQIPDELNGVQLDNKLVVLFFGRIEPYKGVQVLLDALRIVSSKTNSIYTIIAGGGSYMKQLDTAGINNLNVINRFVHDSEIGNIFKSSDVVVLPYLSATQTGVIPMAYAYGKPVIATKVGGLPELVIENKTGFLINQNDTDELASVIMHLADNKLMLNEIGLHVKKYYDEELAWSVISSFHVKKYEMLANNKIIFE